jgi:hypothetical protein
MAIYHPQRFALGDRHVESTHNMKNTKTKDEKREFNLS